MSSNNADLLVVFNIFTHFFFFFFQLRPESLISIMFSVLLNQCSPVRRPTHQIKRIVIIVPIGLMIEVFLVKRLLKKRISFVIVELIDHSSLQLFKLVQCSFFSLDKLLISLVVDVRCICLLVYSS